jgi:hypothetical protein
MKVSAERSLTPTIIIAAVLLLAVTSMVVTAPTLLQLPIAEAKVSMPQEFLYSGPRASIAISGNTSVYLTWWDNKTGNNEVYFAASNDGGKRFGTPINLSNAKGGSADSQVAAQGNNVYITWWDNKTGNWQVFSRASGDNGKTFADALMLKSIGSSPIKKLKAPPANTISVDTLVSAPSNNNEYVVWWDNTTGNWEVSFAKSTDGGKTFGNPINISNSSDTRSVGARMAAQGNNVYISWIDIKPGQKQVMFRSSNDNGETFGSPVIVYGNATSATGRK